MTGRTAFVLVLLAGLLAPTPARAGARSWWNRNWACRKEIVLSRHQRWPGSPAVHVRLATGGRAKDDGSDIRVIDSRGREVPRGIVAAGPGDLFEVAFPAGDEREWTVYYGNPEAKAPREEYRPDRGLVLETRARPPGRPSDWPAMAKILGRAVRVFGGSYWPRIFDAENPFGPSDNYVSIYRGFLHITRPGRYTFYTASDEASFLFVDEKLVAEWPGWHTAYRGAWGKYKGDIDLKPGFHPFRYFHVERTGRQVMAAYWKPPGAKKGRVIPDTAFPGLLVAEVVGVEFLGKKVAPDFRAQVSAKWGMNDQVYTAVTFKALLSEGDALYRWDFGDGVSGEGPIAWHVYLAGGGFDVALTVTAGGETARLVRTIRVPDQWTRFDRNHPEVLERFARVAAAYPVDSLSVLHLERLAFLLDTAGRKDELIPVFRRALETSRTLDAGQRHRLAIRLGRLYLTQKGDRDGAIWAFRRAGEVGGRMAGIESQIAIAETLISLDGDAEVALRLLREALDRLGDRPGAMARRAHLFAGDALMILGRGGEARAEYAKASELAGGPENARRLLKKAAAARAAMTSLENGDLDRAFASLDEWAWNAPEDRYTGLHRIVKAKALLAGKRVSGAVRELTALVDANPDSEYADQALDLLAKIETKRGDAKAAAAFRERLKKDYPWSPLAK